jgi:hypothetical protein
MESTQHECEAILHRPAPHRARTRISTRCGQLDLVARMALAGLRSAALPLEDYPHFYEGLAAVLDSPGADSALYAATCIAEFLRAQREIHSALNPSAEALP